MTTFSPLFQIAISGKAWLVTVAVCDECGVAVIGEEDLMNKHSEWHLRVDPPTNEDE